MSPISRLIPLVMIIALAVTSASAQVQTGTPPFGSFGGGPDVINLANLNAHWTIPLLHKPGRGTNFDYDLTYDSSVWTLSVPPGCQPPLRPCRAGNALHRQGNRTFYTRRLRRFS